MADFDEMRKAIANATQICYRTSMTPSELAQHLRKVANNAFNTPMIDLVQLLSDAADMIEELEHQDIDITDQQGNIILTFTGEEADKIIQDAVQAYIINALTKIVE